MKRYNRIKGALGDAGWTNLQLAEKMGIARETVSNWSRNKTQPSIQDLFRIAEIIGCEPADLLNTKEKAQG